jgi:lipopolysaccharide/colanic/teichoic acid biosynthesis glycosyltransferase
VKLLPPGIPPAKRALDLSIASTGLVVLSPLLAIVALLVRIYHGRPVLFRRSGLDIAAPCSRSTNSAR